MIELAQKNKLSLSVVILMFFGTLSSAHADIKVIVNDDLITTMDIQQGLKAKAARSKDVQMKVQKALQAAMKRRFQSKSTQQKWQQMVSEHPPTSQEEAKLMQKKLAISIQRDVMRTEKPRLLRKYTQKMGRGYRKKVISDLINERLKYQAAKKNNMLMSPADVDKTMVRLAASNKNPQTGKSLTLKQFKMALKSQGVSFKKLKKRIRINNSWQRYVNSKFGRQVSVTEKEIQRMLAADKSPTPKKTASAPQEKILKVSFVFPKKASEAGKSKRVVEANSFSKSVSSCSKITQKAALQSNVEIKYINNGMRHAKIRKALSDRKGGQLSAPVMFNDFVALYAKCGKPSAKKSSGSASLAKRKKVESFLRRKAIARLAKKHLRDLKQDANIEYR